MRKLCFYIFSFLLFLSCHLEFSFAFSGTTSSGNVSPQFQAVYNFQRPTYLLEKDTVGLQKYTCDTAKSACKINLDFRPSFSGSFKESDFLCEIEFGNVQTGEEQKCNPNTIILGTGTTQIRYKITNKNDPAIFDENSFLVENIVVPPGSGTATNSGTTDPETGTGTTGTGHTLELPPLDIEVQSGLDFVAGNHWNCPENGAGDCKINLTLENIFTGSIKESAVACEWDFGSASFSAGTEKKCNPGYVTYGTGVFDIGVRVFEKVNPNNFLTGSIYVTNISQDSGTGATNSGTTDPETGTGTTGTGNILELPPLDIEVQSGLDFVADNHWNCPENGAGDCKINLNLENIFTGSINNSTIACEWNFGSGSFSAGTEKKCNPGYVTYGTGIFDIGVEVFEKVNQNNFLTGSLHVTNISQDVGTGNTASGILEIPILYTFQRPTYLQETRQQFGTGIVYHCDRSKPECKVNLDFTPTFSGTLKESDFVCSVQFGNLETGQEKKCNPSTVTFPVGNTKVEYEFLQKSTNLIATGSFLVENQGYILGSPGGGGNGGDASAPRQEISDAQIEIQSGLQNGICDKKLCSVNLKYENINKNLSCLWDFGDGDLGTTTAEKCNPGYVKFGPGQHIIKLKVYDKNHASNFKEVSLEFENIYKIDELQARIDVQGRLAKYKILRENTLICNGVKECSVNFTGEESSGEIVSWNWNFGNGETFDGKNPKSMRFGVGKYTITLEIQSEDGKKSQKTFFVEVLEEKQEIEEGEKVDYQFLNFWKQLSFVERRKIIEKLKKQKIQGFTLSVRKNKKFATLYGKSGTGTVVLLEERKVAPLFNPWHNDTNYYSSGVTEKNRYKFRSPYEAQGLFQVKGYIYDEVLGKIYTGKVKYYEVEKIVPPKLDTGENIDIPPKLEIVLQGKLGKTKTKLEHGLICRAKTCSVNITASGTLKQFEKFEWNFGKGKIITKKNPKSQKFGLGKHIITLKGVLKNGEVLNREFTVQVIYVKKKRKSRKKKSKKKKYGPVKIMVDLQGRKSKNKVFSGSTITCRGLCSINLDGRKSSGAYKELIWDFGNGKTFIGENPKSVKYTAFGDYVIRVTTKDFRGKLYEKNIQLQILEKQKTDTPREKQSKDPDQIIKNVSREEIFGSGLPTKNGKYFILIILGMIGSGGFILVRRYRE